MPRFFSAPSRFPVLPPVAAVTEAPLIDHLSVEAPVRTDLEARQTALFEETVDR